MARATPNGSLAIICHSGSERLDSGRAPRLLGPGVNVCSKNRMTSEAATRLPTEAQRPRCGRESNGIAQGGLYRCGGRGFVQIFRYDSAFRIATVRSAENRRSGCAAFDQNVAEGAGRGAGPRRETADERRGE